MDGDRRGLKGRWTGEAWERAGGGIGMGEVRSGSGGLLFNV